MGSFFLNTPLDASCSLDTSFVPLYALHSEIFVFQVWALFKTVWHVIQDPFKSASGGSLYATIYYSYLFFWSDGLPLLKQCLVLIITLYGDYVPAHKDGPVCPVSTSEEDLGTKRRSQRCCWYRRMVGCAYMEIHDIVRQIGGSVEELAHTIYGFSNFFFQ